MGHVGDENILNSSRKGKTRLTELPLSPILDGIDYYLKHFL